MKQLLADHIFSDTLRYENHRLIYGSTDQDRMELGGFLGAAVLGALLYGQDEGRERNIALNTSEGQQDFFARYEDETIHENGGFFETEVQALNEAYMEINADKNLLLAICGNERLFDLAFGLTMDYMDKLVEEEVCEHIYDFVPWIGPFARWLYKAGYAETYRQQLLAINWANPEDVYALGDYIKEPEAKDPTFVFGGERADDLLNAYYNWLMTFIEQQAAQYPDSKVKLAEYKQIILQKEPHYVDLKPDMKDFTPEQLNLFREWMNKWVDFMKQQIEPPVTPQKKSIRQELFLDNVMPIPPEHNYVKVREYILERCKYDKEFEKYFKAYKRTDFCDQLSLLFGWFVDPNALGKRMKSKAKK